VLTLTSASGSLSIDIANSGATFGTDLNFTVADGTTTITGLETSWTNVNGGDWSKSAANWSSIVPTAANDATIAPGTSTSAYTVAIAPGEFAEAHNLTINDAFATLDDQGILMLSGGFTLTAGTFLLAGGSLQTALPISIANGGTFEGDGTVSAVGNVAVFGTVVASDAGGPSLDFQSAVIGSGNFKVNAGATLEFGNSVGAGTTITFESGTGELKIDNPETFSGTIAGFSGTAANVASSDVIDLAGINKSSTGFQTTYTNGLLTVTDGTNTVQLTFSNFNQGFVFASDGDGGTLIYDPPASPKASGEAPIELGDNFAFHPGGGATAVSFESRHDASGLDHFASWQPAAPSTSLVPPDEYGQAWIELGHHGGLTPQQFEAALASAVHLH
jgi:hypothetical protein